MLIRIKTSFLFCLNLSCRFIIRKVTASFNMCMYIMYAYIVSYCSCRWYLVYDIIPRLGDLPLFKFIQLSYTIFKFAQFMFFNPTLWCVLIWLWCISDKLFKEYSSTGDWKLFRSNFVAIETNDGFKDASQLELFFAFLA